MKIYFFILIIFLVFQNSYGQHKVIFKDKFANNKNGWKLYHDSDFVVKVYEGKLYIEKLEKNRIRNGCLWYNKIMPNLDLKNDFAIIFYAKALTYGDIFKAFDIQWGNLNNCDTCNVTGNIYQIDFSPNQVRLASFNSEKGWNYFEASTKYKVKKHPNSDERPLKNLIKAGKFNKYKIKQIGNLILIYINNKEVFRKEIILIGGNTIGIQQTSSIIHFKSMFLL
jgi:hypothetical protein